ncbi:MAG TPA: hypothetical protein VF940_02440 [Streptosporangiaceae bacterium]
MVIRCRTQHPPGITGPDHALDAATGKILWSFASGGSVTGGASIVGGSVYWGLRILRHGMLRHHPRPTTTRCTRSASDENGRGERHPALPGAPDWSSRSSRARCTSQCLIDAVVSALVMVASSVSLDYASNARHRSCSGDFHQYVLPKCVADRGSAGVRACPVDL